MSTATPLTEIETITTTASTSVKAETAAMITATPSAGLIIATMLSVETETTAITKAALAGEAETITSLFTATSSAET